MRFRLPVGGSWAGTFNQWRAELQAALLRSSKEIEEGSFDLELSTDTGATITTTSFVYGRYLVDGPICHLWAYWVGQFTVSSPNYISLKLPVSVKEIHTDTAYSFNLGALAYVAASGWQSGRIFFPNYGNEARIVRNAGTWTAGAESRFVIDTHFLVQ
jgi:hypothetical protein